MAFIAENECRNYYANFRILKLDPYNHRCVPLHITILVELKKLNGELVWEEIKFAYLCGTLLLLYYNL